MLGATSTTEMTDAVLDKLGVPAEREYARTSRSELFKTPQAGRTGGDVRSDVRVAFETADTGGIEIELQSRVALYYGKNIRQQVERVLRALGINHGYVRILDEGALPFVIVPAGKPL